MMAVMLFAVFGIPFVRALLMALASAIDDGYHRSESKFTQSWDVKEHPNLIMDDFAGNVELIDGPDSLITAKADVIALSSWTQREADRINNAVGLSISAEANTVRIVTTKPQGNRRGSAYCRIQVQIPRGTFADIKTSYRRTLIGSGYDSTGRLVPRAGITPRPPRTQYRQ